MNNIDWIEHLVEISFTLELLEEAHLKIQYFVDSGPESYEDAIAKLIALDLGEYSFDAIVDPVPERIEVLPINKQTIDVFSGESWDTTKGCAEYDVNAILKIRVKEFPRDLQGNPLTQQNERIQKNISFTNRNVLTCFGQTDLCRISKFSVM